MDLLREGLIQLIKRPYLTSSNIYSETLLYHYIFIYEHANKLQLKCN